MSGQIRKLFTDARVKSIWIYCDSTTAMNEEKWKMASFY